jgi:hypothetical protein
MRDDKFLIKGDKFVLISFAVEDNELTVSGGVLSEIDLETGNYLPVDGSVTTKKQLGKFLAEFRNTIALMVAKLLAAEFIELREFRENKAFFANRMVISDDTPIYVEKRLKKI